MGKWLLLIFVFFKGMTLQAQEGTPLTFSMPFGEPRIRMVSFLRYMTAYQMQSRIHELTGYYHQDFITYRNALGWIDPSTGQRTSENPNVVSIVYLQNITKEVATSVLRREQFLDDEELVVFQGITIDPRDPHCGEEFPLWALVTWQRWFGGEFSEETSRELNDYFSAQRETEGCIKAYEAVLSLYLSHGANFYY